MHAASLAFWGTLCTVVPCLAQTPAFAVAPLLPLSGTGVFDARRNVVTVLQSGSMWDWDGTSFRQRLGLAPTYSSGTSWAVYDPQLGEIHKAVSNGIATWNGVNWRSAPTPTMWPLSGMAFDVARRRVVRLFSNSTDVAEWDGAQWARITPPASPGTGGFLVYDSTRGRCVRAAGDPLTLWSWDGGTWTLVDGNGPAGQGTSGITFDPGGNRLLVHGGSPVQATWAYEGAAWVSVPTPPSFTQSAFTFVFDGTGMLRCSVVDGFWRLEGNVWRRLPIEYPVPRSAPGLASSPSWRQALMFGGSQTPNTRLDDTWTFDGTWQRQVPGQSPPPRENAGLAWSAAEQRFLLFGGKNAQQQVLADTWAWDGTNWMALQPANAPAARTAMAMTGDPSGGVLLLGGRDTSQLLADHWRWQNGSWQQVGAAPGLAAQYQAVACHDLQRNQTVAVIGSQTWIWDGTNWVQGQSVPFSPSGPLATAIVWRPETRTVLILESSQYTRATAEWDGTQWTLLGPAHPSSSIAPQLVSDFENQRVWNLSYPFGGLSVFTATPAQADRFGYGCAFGATPGLSADGRPRLGNAAFAIDTVTLLPNAPLLLAIGFTEQGQHLGSGCVVWIAQPPAIHFLAADAAGHARFSLPIPAQSSLLGVQLLAQAAVFDPARSPLGSIVLTDGLRISIGD